METLTLALGDRGYPIHIGEHTLSQLPAELTRLEARGAVAVCTDANVAARHGEKVLELVRSAGVTPVLCVMPAGEEAKQLVRIEEFCGMFLEAGLDRSSVVVALGGGVPGDVAGFAAASFMRGIRFIQIPTTIVAQVDSSVGGKTGVNHALGKNTLGAFHQPSAVIIDLTLLKTLPDRELRAGLAEVIKHGMIADAALFDYLEDRVAPILAKDLDALMLPVRRSCEIKAAVVAEDEKEHGLRAILNYGHTFGHGIEAVTRYGVFLHGEAVALGMQAAAVLAHNLGLLSGDAVARQRACLEAYGLPVRWPDLPVDETLAAMKHDKKARAGTLKFIVADRIGHVVQRTDIPEEQARAALLALK
ncbi:MAG TPA: 3-dehydroquinate synthase [Candidatus Hydrogenedentes bacterium]|nr:3-dehydroquinate synthase [Candidatus Hydrogenedentota bacterium]